MAEIKIGDKMVELSTGVYARSQMKSLDEDFWYVEMFKTLPVYKFTMEINRTDEDEEFDIYNVIFNDIVASGEYTPLIYEYNKEKNNVGFMPIDIEKSGGNSDEIYTSRFILVSNTEPIMISYECDAIVVQSHLGMDKINSVVERFLTKYDQDDNNIKCYVIVKETDLYMDDFDIKLNGDLDFDLYNEGFEEIHKTIVKSIVDDENGLYLLYGKPGTGKSTYIRHLIKECGNEKRKFVYVPSKLFEDFTDPGILPFLLRNKGCIFIIEDCENLVTLDGGIRSDGITDLLNMTDGLLADALDIKIICTFNTDYHKIDDALLRPGRCRCKYEFDLLEKDRANNVAQKLGLKSVNRDISLAELFNPEIEFVDEKKKKIGFK